MSSTCENFTLMSLLLCACSPMHKYAHASAWSFTSLGPLRWWMTAPQPLASVLDTVRSCCNVDPNVARLSHQSRSTRQMENKWDMPRPQTDKRLHHAKEAAIVLLWTIGFLPPWIAVCGERWVFSCGWQWTQTHTRNVCEHPCTL